MLGKKRSTNSIWSKIQQICSSFFYIYFSILIIPSLVSCFSYLFFFDFQFKKNIHSFSPPRPSLVDYSATNESLNHILCHQRQGTPTGQSRYRADVWLIILLILGESHSIISQKCLYCKLCVLGCLCCHLKISLFPQTLLKYLFH